MFVCVRPYEKPLNRVPNSIVRQMSNSEYTLQKSLKKYNSEEEEEESNRDTDKNVNKTKRDEK